jgi:hypothetical protein
MGIKVHRQGALVNITTLEGGKETVIPCRDIRGSAVFPGLHPGYYCIFAQGNYPTLSGKLPLVLLGEAEDALPHKFFQKMIEAAREFQCRDFYKEERKEERELMTLFADVCRHQRVYKVNILFGRAKLSKNFPFGVRLTKEWAQDGALNISEGTILRTQLSAISAADLDQNPEDKFYAVDALRLLIGSIEKEPWQVPAQMVREQEKADPRGWT